MIRSNCLRLGLLAAAAGAIAAQALAAPVTLELKNHRFNPPAIVARAGEPIVVQLINHDMATEEFDSHDLRIEKLVTPGGRITFQLGPLKPGDYRFMGEFHPGTAQGRVIISP